jgi:hypothetical protein
MKILLSDGFSTFDDTGNAANSPVEPRYVSSLGRCLKLLGRINGEERARGISFFTIEA